MKTCKKCIHYRACQNLCYEIVTIAEGDGFENDRHCERWAVDCDGYMELTDFVRNIFEEYPEIIRRVQYNEDL